MRALMLWWVCLGLWVTPACVDGGEGGSKAGEVQLTKGTGIDLVTGEFHQKFNFTTTDIYATTNGDYLRLSSGGKITDPRPVNFFLGPSGFHQQFEGLADIPHEFPDEELNAALIYAKAKNGFVVQLSNGSYAKGWIRDATSTEVTIEYAHIN